MNRRGFFKIISAAVSAVWANPSLAVSQPQAPGGGLFLRFATAWDPIRDECLSRMDVAKQELPLPRNVLAFGKMCESPAQVLSFIEAHTSRSFSDKEAAHTFRKAVNAVCASTDPNFTAGVTWKVPDEDIEYWLVERTRKS